MVRSRWRGWRHTIPTEVAMLALLLCGSALLCLLGALFPMSPKTPVELGRALAPWGFVVGGALLVAGARTPRWALHGSVVFLTLAAALLMSQAATSGGVMVNAWSFAWVSIYVALFFRPPAARAHVALMTVVMAAAIAVAGHRGTAVAFVLMAVTMWTVALALGSLSERLRAQADTDHLTRLLNRHGFTKAATREIALASRTGNPLTLALIDLDGFKAVNDEHGHAAGDLLLVELGKAWAAAMRPGDLLARHGGDEFVVLFPATSEADARVALARMGEAHTACWSAGVAAWAPGERLDDTLARADGRLYEAKAGRAADAGAFVC